MALRISRALRPVASASSSLRASAARSHRSPLQRLPLRAASSTPTPAKSSAAPAEPPPAVLDDPLPAAPPATNGHGNPVDWGSSFHGLSTTPFAPEIAEVLMREIKPEDIEIKPDGIAYLPEIKYRRILNQAFGPGGWGLAPRGDLEVGDKVVTREYALVVHGRFIAQARGECSYFGPETIPTAGEGCKSNALMRCCKDLGIASELWDPVFIRDFRRKFCHEVWAEHVTTKKKRLIWLRKGLAPVYPYKKTTTTNGSSS